MFKYLEENCCSIFPGRIIDKAALFHLLDGWGYGYEAGRAQLFDYFARD